MPALRPARTAASHGHGALAIVLHTHMPYVEGFGTWPFGEEWLWEALAGSYLPLLDVLEQGAPLTVSLSPVLCDQLECEDFAARFERFVLEVRSYTHTEDATGLRTAGETLLAEAVECSWLDYEHALEAMRLRGGDLLGAFGPFAQWTSSATHAVLPLLATDEGVEAQVSVGVRSHRERFGRTWRGGFWLPECAFSADLAGALGEAGVRHTCVELTGRLGLGAPDHLRPVQGEADVTLVPIDRATMSLVWSDGGYPSHGLYRDYHRHTIHHHNPWCNDGSPYDRDRAHALARTHAADFVERVQARLRASEPALGGPGLAVCALDTELLGHWWYEGVAWLAAVVDECAAQGLQLLRLDDALERIEPADGTPDLGVHTWGANNDISTWSGPAVAELAFAARAAELDVAQAGPDAGEAAMRELLALQASDWAFMVSRGLAVPYALERASGHRERLERALADGPHADSSALRNLAIHACKRPALTAS